MAQKIKFTPILTGKTAENFIKRSEENELKVESILCLKSQIIKARSILEKSKLNE